MSNQWLIQRGNDVRQKYAELYAQLDHVCETFKHLENVKTLSRVIVEEISNTIQHDKRWTWIKMNTKYNETTDNIKIKIFHNGDFFDPEARGIKNVMGSTKSFAEYIRKMELGKNEMAPYEEIVIVRLQIKPSLAVGGA